MEEQRRPLEPLDDVPMMNGNGLLVHRERILRQNNREVQPIVNLDEQIIQSRGRRELPRTPVRKSPRKRPADVVFASPRTPSKLETPGESPLTKCLRGLTSPDSTKRRYHPEQSSIVRRLNSIFGEPKDRRQYYYSPTTYKLRSSDRHLNDSGIEVTPDVSISSISSEIVSPESTIDLDSSFSSQTSISTTSSSTSTSTSNRRINRVKRRFRF